MEERHLTYEELERYGTESDFSEENLCFCESVTAHLDECRICRDRLDKMVFVSELLDTDNLYSAVKLVGREEAVRRRSIALRLEMMTEEQRLLEVAKRLQMGLLMNLSVAKADLYKKQAVFRDQGNGSADLVTVEYTGEKLKVYVPCEEKKRVTVILTPVKDKNMPIQVASARWFAEEKRAVAEFSAESPEESYEIYVDTTEE